MSGFDLHATERLLARTPGVLRAMLHDAPGALTDAPYGPGTWSAREVVAHLIFGERTDWIPRARHILAHGDAQGKGAAFEAFDRAGHKPLMEGRSTADLVELFARERDGSLAALRAMNLSPADLARRGVHPSLGPVTLGNLIATWAVHDLNHIAQICKAMAYQFKGEVGAWEAYLSVLAPPSPR